MEVYDFTSESESETESVLKDLIQMMSTQQFAHMKLLQGQGKVFPVLVL